MNAKKILPPIAAMLLLPLAAAAQINSMTCTYAPGNGLPVIPEISSNTPGVLNGTLYTVSEQVEIPAMSTAGGFAHIVCYPQWVRAYRAVPPKSWKPTSMDLGSLAMPGPTLRARVGDVVTLSFYNYIDANKFPKADAGCDETNVYPKNAGDHYPDCFAESVFTNVHYHGTHTNPNTTGDNVFLNVKPSPRSKDGNNTPLIKATDIQPLFDRFFERCRAELIAGGPKIWPRKWADLADPKDPPPQTNKLGDKLLEYVKNYGLTGLPGSTGLTDWYHIDLDQIANGNWPQYYVGAYPYCFKLPAYTSAPSTASATVHTPHTHGIGSVEKDEAAAPERPMLMGQTPGTHWYHAHKHGSTTINVLNGMTGVFIIEGQYDDDINKFYGKDWTKEQPVMVIQQLGSVPGLMTGAGGGPGPEFTVNGAVRPFIRMESNSVAMLRIANTSSRAGVYFEKPPAGLHWRQLAQDGVQFKPAIYAASEDKPFQLSSGNRADLLIKAPPYVERGTNTYSVKVYNTVDPTDRPPQKPSAPAQALFIVSVSRPFPSDAKTSMEFIPENQAPKFPDFLKDITDDELMGTKILKFASTAVPPTTQHTIDGKLFDGELGAVVELNRAEEWKIVNETYGPARSNQISHPFHIHINPFQVTEVFDPNAVLSSKPGDGKVTVANPEKGNSVVTGSGTDFTTTFRVGDFIWINGGDAPGAIVQSIEGKSQLTLNYNIKEEIRTGVSYTSAIPLYTIDPKNARERDQCLVDPKAAQPCGETVPKNQRIWWDVFPIPSGGTFYNPDGSGTTKIPGYFKMRSRFVDYAGYFVLHCHILAHEDRGMMTVVEVAPLQTPYSHH